MANFNGFGGGGNMQQLIRQAQKLQEQMEKDREALQNSIVNASSGGGIVEVKMNGKHELVAISIKKEAVDPDDVEMLEDLIMACINDANRQIDELAQKMMPNIPGGMF
ncbi:MAG: YbaB/EbfC family nucleoid-associated protein [Clostridia bacterium]|nr:YbaB/EbfC family nucleoid-associated protein [Clostridia bacterium]